MNIVESVINITIEFLCIFFVSRAFTETKEHLLKTDIAFVVSSILAGCIIPEKYNILLLITGQVIFFTYILYRYSDTMLNRFFLFILSFGTTLLCQLIVMCLFMLFSLSLFPGYEYIMLNFCTFILIFLICRIFPVHNIYNLLINSSLPLRCIYTDTYVILLSFLLMGKLNLQNLYSKYIFVFVSITLLAAANICIIYYDQKMFYQQRELLSYMQKLPIYETLVDDIRTSQHEYSNHLQTLRALPLSCPDYNSLCHALEQYTLQYSSHLNNYPLIQINMPLLAAALYSLFSSAEQKGISILFNIYSTVLKSTLPEYLLTDYVCILVNNATDACQKNDSIFIYLSSSNGKTRFEIRNPSTIYYSPNKISQFFQSGYSTKNSDVSPRKHGYGLYYLLKNITKAKGDIGASCIKYNNQYQMIFFIEV